MPDNLTIQISADSSKMRADLALAERSLRDMRKELKLAADEAQKTGDRTRLDKVSKEFQRTEREVRQYSRALRDASRAHEEVASTTDGAIKGVVAIAAAFRGVVAGATAAAGAVYGVGKAVGSVTDSLTQIRNISAGTGGLFSPQDVKIFQEFMEDAGVETDVARMALTRFTDKLGEARDKGGAAAAGFNELGVDLDVFGRKLDVGAQVLVDFGNKYLALQKTDPLKAMTLGVDMFGKQWSVVAAGIEELAASGAWAKMDAELQKQNRAITPEALARLREYRIAWNELKDAIEALIQPLVITLFPALTAGINRLTKGVENAKENIKGLIDFFVADWKRLTDVLDAATPYWQVFADAATKSFEQVSAVINGIIDGIKWIGSAAGKVLSVPPVGGAPAPMAAGGYVSGPGGPTSDSILARLSDGEYVMRARAVERWGPQFMEMLNNLRDPFAFAQGGMVRARSIPRFAGGGLVAGGGATVNLVFPGGSFALQADNAIVGSLTREAKRAGMLAGGRRAGLLQ